MQLLITGADTPLGQLVAAELGQRYELRLVREPGADAGSETPGIAVDLRIPAEVEPLMAGVEVVVHLAPYTPATSPDADTEREVLDQAGRGTFVLLHEALKAGVKRVVLASRLELFAAYPEECLVDETWKPLPDTTARGLAPYLAELTLREFVRAEPILGVCLRMGEIGESGTTAGDAVCAMERALLMDPGEQKYRWWLYHISSTQRFASDAAGKEPLCWSPVGAGARE